MLEMLITHNNNIMYKLGKIGLINPKIIHSSKMFVLINKSDETGCI